MTELLEGEERDPSVVGELPGSGRVTAGRVEQQMLVRVRPRSSRTGLALFTSLGSGATSVTRPVSRIVVNVRGYARREPAEGDRRTSGKVA